MLTRIIEEHQAKLLDSSHIEIEKDYTPESRNVFGQTDISFAIDDFDKITCLIKDSVRFSGNGFYVFQKEIKREGKPIKVGFGNERSRTSFYGETNTNFKLFARLSQFEEPTQRDELSHARLLLDFSCNFLDEYRNIALILKYASKLGFKDKEYSSGWDLVGEDKETLVEFPELFD